MALGANSTGVVRLVLRRVLWLTAIGVAAGTRLSWWAARFVASLLYGLQPRDPLSPAAAAGLLAAVGMLAGWIPARRAARTDAAIVLRQG
jgi:putative ABC transport system permease protein